METIEGNILVAEFDGWYQKERSGPGIFSPENPYYRDNGKEAASIHGFKYHTSWDWLMPCIKKFNNMVIVGDIEHDMQSSALHDLIEQSMLLCNITATHNYFTQLLEWYNQQPK